MGSSVAKELWDYKQYRICREAPLYNAGFSVACYATASIPRSVQVVIETPRCSVVLVVSRYQCRNASSAVPSDSDVWYTDNTCLDIQRFV